ncbi:hypothetical protein [Halomicronema sp. CCY15110]|uniref:hypothetical protein n=1 Tax=Halomicronema sp. CCY15110 TaxID=2767773 RepID=UPI00194E9B8A|nr:hypothetical protein [Halomicronema sp. CCY15110]
MIAVNIAITLAGIAGIVLTFVLLKVLLNGLFHFSTRLLADTWLQHHTTKITHLRQNATVVLLVACILLCVVVAGVNGVLIYQERSVPDFYLNWVSRIPREFWHQLAIDLLKCASLLLLVKISLPSVGKLLDRASVITQNSDQISANDESIEVFFNTFKKVSFNGLWLLAFIICADFLYTPDVVIKYLRVGLKAYLAVSFGRLIIKLLSVLVDTLDALSLEYSSATNVLRHYERFRHLVPALKKALEYIFYVIIAALVLQDIDSIAWITSYADEIIQIIGLYFICGVIIEVSNIILEDLVLKTDRLTDLYQFSIKLHRIEPQG